MTNTTKTSTKKTAKKAAKSASKADTKAKATTKATTKATAKTAKTAAPAKKKLDKLSQAQIDAMPKYVEKWVNIGLSTERVDFEKVKPLVAMCYEKAGYTVPRMHFVRGPEEGYAKYLELGGKPGRSEYTSGCMFGSMEASWLSYYDYYKNETDIEIDNIDHMKELVMNSGWVYLGDTDAIIHDRPVTIARDDQGRLHSETGPAIAYGDSWQRFFWHGVAIPAEWITDRSKLTAEIAIGQENVELRRCACEILGWANVIKNLKSKQIDKDPDPMVGTLYEVDLPDMGKEKFLVVQCGTGRTFAIPVPPEMKTALAANSWSYNLKNPEDLRNLEVRT